MSDLVKELREAQQDGRERLPPDFSLYGKAADVIERLRDVLTAVLQEKIVGDDVSKETWGRVIAVLREVK